MVMRCWLRPLSTARKARRQGKRKRTGTKDDGHELLLSHMVFADNRYILATGSTMLMDVSKNARMIIQCDLEWKTNDIQCVSWRSALDDRDLEFIMHGVNKKSPKVQDTLVMRSLLSIEEEQSNVSNKDRNVLLQECWHPERRKHERYKPVVQASFLHTSETCRCTKELVDRLHRFQSRYVEMTGTRT